MNGPPGKKKAPTPPGSGAGAYGRNRHANHAPRINFRNPKVRIGDVTAGEILPAVMSDLAETFNGGPVAEDPRREELAMLFEKVGQRRKAREVSRLLDLLGSLGPEAREPR